MENLNQEAEIVIIQTIQNHINILWQIDQGVKGYTEADKYAVKKELEKMEAELTRRYPDYKAA